MLAGCVQYTPLHTHDPYDLHRYSHDIEARLVDVPFPVSTSIRTVDHDDTASIIRADISLALRDVQTFYISSMEHAGWQVRATCAGDVMHTAVYEKPYKMCVVTIEKEQESPPRSSLVVSYMPM